MSKRLSLQFLLFPAFLIIFTFQTFGQTSYYVNSKSGNDNNSGLSPTQAWQTINRVNTFSGFKPGDSVLFARNQRFSGAELGPPVDGMIFSSYGTGTKATIDGLGVRRCVNLLESAHNRDHITFYNMRFVNGTPRDIESYGSNYLTIDSCNVDSAYASSINMQNIFVGGNTVRGFHAINSTFNYAGAPLGANGLGHGMYISGVDSSTVEHCEIMYNQTTGFRVAYGSNPYFTDDLTFRYNKVQFNWDEQIDDDGSRNSKYYYNLIESQLTTWSPPIVFFYQNGYYPNNVKIYNNTIISHTSNKAIQTTVPSSSISNIEVKNNIIYLDNNADARAVYLPSPVGTWTFDNNTYYKAGGATNLWSFDGTAYNSLSSWQTKGFDIHSINADPQFTNSSGGNYYPKSSSPVINKGTNVGLTKDILGDPIVNAPDMGAYEYQGQSSTGINISIDVILSGCYKNGSMQTTLQKRGFIPAAQPYNTSPWNYNGNETITNTPSGVVDWVLVELRSSTSSSSVVARKAALLESNGVILNPNGISPLNFSSVSPGSYYIVIRHRNHISIMSANKVNLSSTTTDYNFTDSESKAYGTSPMENLGNGVYGLYSGDANSDGTVSDPDISTVWLTEFLHGKDGYNAADFNLDGSVTASDNNIYWMSANGKTSQVPN